MDGDKFVVTDKIGRSIMEMMETAGVPCQWDRDNNIITSKNLVRLPFDIAGNVVYLIFRLYECGFTTEIACAQFRLDPDHEYPVLKYLNWANELGIPGNVMKLRNEDFLITERYTDCLDRKGSAPITEKMNMGFNLALQGYARFVDGAILTNESEGNLQMAMDYASAKTSDR